MKMRTVAALALVLLTARAGAAEPATHGVVTAQDVRVRSGPGKNYRDMCTLDRDAVVRVVGVSGDGEWLRITAPQESDVWIFAKFVDVNGALGVVNGDKVRVRARPELTGEMVNQVNTGTVVRVKSQKGDWLRIAPPDGTEAWVSAGHVKRMTDAEFAAHQAVKAREQAEAERLAREDEQKAAREAAEEARKRAAEARKAFERKLCDDADALLAAELDKEFTGRALDAARKAFEAARAQVRDDDLLKTIAAKLAIIEATQAVQAAIAAEAEPPHLDFDIEETKKTSGVGREVDDLLAACEQARQLAGEAAAARIADAEKALSGWVVPAGPALANEGIRYRIVRDRRTVAFLQSDRIDLDAFAGIRVQVSGEPVGEAKLPGGETAQVVYVERIVIVLP